MRQLALLLVLATGLTFCSDCEGLISEITRAPLAKRVVMGTSIANDDLDHTDSTQAWKSYTYTLLGQSIEATLPQQPNLIEGDDCSVLLAISDDSFYMIVSAKPNEDDPNPADDPEQFLADMRSNLESNVEVAYSNIRREGDLTIVDVALHVTDEECYVKMRMFITAEQLIILTTVDLEQECCPATTLFLDSFKLLS